MVFYFFDVAESCTITVLVHTTCQTSYHVEIWFFGRPKIWPTLLIRNVERVRHPVFPHYIPNLIRYSTRRLIHSSRGTSMTTISLINTVLIVGHWWPSRRPSWKSHHYTCAIYMILYIIQCHSDSSYCDATIPSPFGALGHCLHSVPDSF